ncbi:MAG: hypothetical protein ABI380_02465 [Edaphobacter sp.]
MNSAKKFRGMLEPDNTNLKWIIVKLPFDPTEAWKATLALLLSKEVEGKAHTAVARVTAKRR